MKKNLRTLAALLSGFLFIYTAQAQFMSRFWGTTYLGGKYNGGTIFVTEPEGNNPRVVYSFPVQHEGKSPFYSAMCLAPNGKLYGLTSESGLNNNGLLFEYDYSSDVYTVKKYFNDSVLGKNPKGSLMCASNGKLYGMTYAGGNFNYGVLFEYDPVKDSISAKFHFDGPLGKYPFGTLAEAPNSVLYGMTKDGGSKGMGVLFKYDLTSNTFTKTVDFDGTLLGSAPYGTLMMAANNKFYGVTQSGGTKNKGTLFEYIPGKDLITKKAEFDGINKGANPYARLIQMSNGKIYGMTSMGGTFNFGSIFEYDTTTATITKKINFDGTNGSYPDGGLLVATNGKLYGQTYSGGTTDNGVLFEYDPSTISYIVKVNFDGTTKGSGPNTMVQATNGKLYGMTVAGGSTEAGILFEYDPASSAFTKKADFDVALNGKKMAGGILVASNNKFYGLTSEGGTYNKGVLFEFNPKDSTYIKRIDFDGVNGARPFGDLIQAGNGLLYGLTSEGGVNNLGVLFKYNTANNTLIKIFDFDDTQGKNPYGSLTYNEGILYGLTMYGGAKGMGVIFSLDYKDDSYTKIIDLDKTTTGSNPKGTLIKSKTGDLIGVTSQGGANNVGTLFRYIAGSSNLYKTFSFSYDQGCNPEGILMSSKIGNIFGTTPKGGKSNKGTIFGFNPYSEALAKLADFADSTGTAPMGPLMESHKGLFYGMASKAGKNGLGVMFEYNYVLADTVTENKIDFNLANGALPYRNSVFEICDSAYIAKQSSSVILDSLAPTKFTVTAYGNSLTFQWFVKDTTLDVYGKLVDGGAIAGAKSTVLTVKNIVPCTKGYYFYCQVISRCPVDTLYTNIVKLTTNYTIIEDKLKESKESLEVYPNPTAGSITISRSGGEATQIVIVDLTGRTVKETIMQSDQIQMNLEDQPSGIYVLKAIFKDGTKELRINKQ